MERKRKEVYKYRKNNNQSVKIGRHTSKNIKIKITLKEVLKRDLMGTTLTGKKAHLRM